MSWWEQQWGDDGWRGGGRQWASSSWSSDGGAWSQPQGTGSWPQGGAGLDGHLLALLESQGLTSLSDTLSSLGVVKASDISYLTEQDLENEGIKIVKCRQLLALVAGGEEDSIRSQPSQNASGGGSQGGETAESKSAALAVPGAPAPAIPGAASAAAGRCEEARGAGGSEPRGAPGGSFARRCGASRRRLRGSAAKASSRTPIPTEKSAILKAIVAAARAGPGKSRPPSWAHPQVTEAEVPERPPHWPELARPDPKAHTSWLPKDWSFGHKLTRGGKLLVCYVSNTGRMRFHKSAVEEDVGRKLTTEERGVKSHARLASGEFGDPETTVLKRTTKSVGKPAAYIDERCKLLDGLTVKAALTEFKYDRNGKQANYTTADLKYDLKYGRITTELAAASQPSAPEAASASQGGG